MSTSATNSRRKGTWEDSGDAHAYRRVSTDDQAESGAGLAAQLDACNAWTDRHGYRLLGPYTEDEGVCGATPLDRRPALMELVAALKPGDVVLVAKRDRIMRDRIQIAMFEALLRTRKCRLVSAAGEGTDAEDPNDPMAFLLRGIVDLFAEFERLVIKFRTTGSMQAKRRRGELTGRVPYGLRLVDDGRRTKRGDRPMKLEPDPAELVVLTAIRAYRTSGLTFRRIAEVLNDRGIPSPAKLGGRPNRGKWSAGTVHHLITSPHPLTLLTDANQNQTAQEPPEDVPPLAG